MIRDSPRACHHVFESAARTTAASSAGGGTIDLRSGKGPIIKSHNQRAGAMAVRARMRSAASSAGSPNTSIPYSAKASAKARSAFS